MQSIKNILKMRSLSSFLFVILLFLIVGIMNSDFLSSQNLLLTINSSVVFTLISIGIAFVIISGEIDVSVGAVMGLSAAISATLIRDGHSAIFALIVILIIGALCGLFNGIGLMYIGIPSIIITLGSNGIIRGLIYVYTKGKWIENIPFAFKELSQKTTLGFSNFYLIALFFAILGTIILFKTKKGKYFLAVGDNINGATLIGIPVKKTKILAFILSSIFASLSGYIYVSRIGFVTPTAGLGYEMKAIAACVLGGVSLSGGVGTLIGASLGAIIMSSIGRILVFLKFSSDYDNTITGLLLITIVVIDSLLLKHQYEKSRKSRLLAKTKGGENE